MKKHFSHLFTALLRINHREKPSCKPCQRDRKLHFEGLENRRMLYVTGLEATCMEVVVLDDGVFGDFACCEEELNSVPPDVIPLEGLEESDVNHKTEDAVIDTEQDADLATEPEQPDLSLTVDAPPSKVVYIDGEPYVLASELPTRDSASVEVIQSPQLLEPELLLNEEEGEEYELNLQVAISSALDATSHPLTVNPLREGYNTVVNPNDTEIYGRSPDYIEITAPAVPKGYYLPLTFSGSATLGSDYVVLISQSQVGHAYSTSTGFEYTGGPFTFCIYPLDDYETELDETVTVTIGAPWSVDPMTTVPYQFTSSVPCATATIVDNDDWKVAVHCLSEADEQGNVVLTEASQDYALFKVVRQDAGFNRSGDLQYPVIVQLEITGDVTTSDYHVYGVNTDSTLSVLTPSANNLLTVTIPVGTQETSIVIRAVDDNLVEQLYESLVLTVHSAQCAYSNTPYSKDSTGAYINIKDNDLLTISTVKFTNNENLLSDTSGTFGTNWKDATQHWIRTEPSATLPVCYASSKKMRCNITVTGIYDANRTFLVRMKWTYNLGDGEQTSVYSDWTELTGNTTVSLPSTFQAYFGAQRTYYDLASTLSWEFKTANDGDDRGEDGDMGDSQHPLYVTYSAPLANAQMFHTTVHLGCVAASASVNVPSNEADVFNTIWLQFASMLNYKVELVNGIVTTGELLTYYGKEPIGINLTVEEEDIKESLPYMIQDGDYITESTSLAREVDKAHEGGFDQIGLLRYGDGTCESWQNFACHIFLSQEINVVAKGIRCVNNMYLRVNPELQGQGLVIPRENIWRGHAVFEYNNVIYDPSYGVTYGNVNSALYAFINNLHSIGTCTVAPYQYYVWKYTPTTLAITPADFIME